MAVKMWKEIVIFGIFLVSTYYLFRDHAEKVRREQQLAEENRAIEELIREQEGEGEIYDEEDGGDNMDEYIDEAFEQWEQDEDFAFQRLQQQELERLQRLHAQNNHGGNVPEMTDLEFDQRMEQMTPEQLEDLRQRINPRPPAGPSSSRTRTREVGAKKAKSLARRDRIRAYNEYMRQRSLAEKLAQEEYENNFRELIEEEKRTRQARQAEAEEQIRQRQIEKRKREEEEKLRKIQRRQEIENRLEIDGKAEISQDDTDFVQGISNAIIVGEGDQQWIVRVGSPGQLEPLARALGTEGRVSFADLAKVL